MTKPDPLGNYKRFFIVMGVLCLAAIVLNLAVRRGPVQDATAVEDLRSISGWVANYYSAQSQLPSDLADIKSSLPAATWQRIHNYEYMTVAPTIYRLCATFHAASTGNDRTKIMPYPGSGNDDPGAHGKGHQCFQFTAVGFNDGTPRPL